MYAVRHTRNGLTSVGKGTMTFGFEGKNGVRTSSLTECQDILDVFFGHGHTEVDTARMYAEGTTEQVGYAAFDPMKNRVFTHNPCIVSLGPISPQSR